MNTRRIVSVVMLVFVVLTFSVGQSKKNAAKQSCWHTAKTQAELNECAATDAQKADAELNRIYSALLQKLKNDPTALESLKESERQWLKYRDAQVKALHPHPEEEGSVHPMCMSSEIAELTTQRIKALQSMMHPVEGDVCAYIPNE
jgi:uncharacterized protein YecT (DUF1311 family)